MDVTLAPSAYRTARVEDYSGIARESRPAGSDATFVNGTIGTRRATLRAAVAFAL